MLNMFTSRHDLENPEFVWLCTVNCLLWVLNNEAFKWEQLSDRILMLSNRQNTKESDISMVNGSSCA